MSKGELMAAIANAAEEGAPEPGEPPTMNFSVATNSQLLATLEEF
jgi:hypothetical protein